jgi:hypothetical protein
MSYAASRQTAQPSHSPASPLPLNPRSTTAVANLCDQRIALLSRNEMIALIAACQHLWTEEDLTGRLPFADDKLLRRLAYLARQCCRARAGHVAHDLAT